tara:strand:- start:95 stop:892 length:798 start_codon:yes stop_codon:yes gene_type:complete
MEDRLTKFYKNESNIFKKITKNETLIKSILISGFFIILFMILYSRLFIHVDFENWEVQKCNPKYIFYSGYIKNNTNSDSMTSTIDNFNDCIIKYNQLNSSNSFQKLLEKKAQEDAENNKKIVNDYNLKSSQKIMKYKRELDETNKYFKSKINDLESLNTTREVKDEMKKLNEIIEDIREYAHSYLTYAMMHFVFKLKISEKKNTASEVLDSTSCDILNKIDCDNNKSCNYDTPNGCVNTTKGKFYYSQALKMNNLIKKYFSDNKL